MMRTAMQARSGLTARELPFRFAMDALWIPSAANKGEVQKGMRHSPK